MFLNVLFKRFQVPVPVVWYLFLDSQAGRRPAGQPSGQAAALQPIREMGGAPWNPAPRNHFLVWIVSPSGCHCTDGRLTSRVLTEDQQIS